MANITMRIDDETKTELQELVGKLGLDITTYFMMAAKQAIREQGIPFKVTASVPNADTLEAMAEVKRMKENPSEYKGYDDVDKMMEDLLA